MKTLPAAAAALLLWSACATAPPAPPRPKTASGLQLAYRVTYLKAPHALEVEVQLTGPARDFRFTQPGGVATVTATVDGQPRELGVADDGGLRLPAGTTALRYRYDPGAGSGRRMGGLFSGTGQPGSLLVAGRAYLVRPRAASGVTATLVVEGAPALLPWAPGPDGAYHLRGVDLVDSGFHSFGGRRCTQEVGGARIEVALHPGPRKVPDPFVCEWIRAAAHELLTVRPDIPWPRLSVHVVSGWGDEPSSLGLLLWSTPPSLALVVGRDAPKEAFGRDWVAVHELLHTLHPSFMRKAPWLTEGLATYYQEVARMRSRRLSPQEAWTELLLGFERGREEGGKNTLAQTEAALSHGVYVPLYQAGALLMLEVDLRIREVTNGGRSLDDVLVRLSEEGPTSTVEAFGRAVDEVAGEAIWRPIFDARKEEHAFIREGPVLERLGVRLKDRRAEFFPGPSSQHRDAIGIFRSHEGN